MESKSTISYENYMHGIEQRGLDSFLVDGKQIKVDTTDFSKIDMEELCLMFLHLWSIGLRVRKAIKYWNNLIK